MRSARFSPNHSLSCASIIPRRGPDPLVGVLKIAISPVLASILPTSSAPITRKNPLFCESGITSYTFGRGILYGSNTSNVPDCTSSRRTV